MKEVLLTKNEEQLEQLLGKLRQPEYRAEQLMEWIYQHREDDFSKMTNLPKQLREALQSFAQITDVKIEEHLISEDEQSEKFALRMKDKSTVEAAVMRYSFGTSLCVSTQVGCAVECSFCASGARGLTRNLTTHEIVSQWFLTQQSLDDEGERISHIVVMGMGEPLHNYDSLVRSLRIFHSQTEGAGISYRRMTVSTAGVAPKIRELANEEIPVTLAVSLHAPNDYLRDRIVPLNEQYSLEELIDSSKYYTEKTGRRVTFEYAMMKGVNDHPELARELAILLDDMICHVNLIQMNPVPGSDFTPSSREAVEEFAEVLEMMGINVTIRRPLGLDIHAACGQLRERVDSS